jgi:hypothetical protein
MIIVQHFLEFKTPNVFFYFVKVPTVAIESVWIAVNNSIIQDEVLSHRVGKLIRMIFLITLCV